MKTLKNIFPKTTLILLLITVVISSCSSDDDNDANGSDYYLTVKIDGAHFSANSGIFVSTLADDTGSFTIEGLDIDGIFRLGLASPTAEGTFTTTLGDNVTLLSYQQSNPTIVVWAATQDVGSGTITITENNATYMEGTFSFTGVNIANSTTKEFTEGKFKAKKL